jgi:short-subunit dehydrogenase
VVTGASSGIGAAFARQLAAAGLGVVLVARREPELRQLAHEIEGAGGRAEVAAADLRDDGERARVGDVVDRDDVALLVNCAGVARHGPVHETARHEALAMVDLNVAAFVDLTKRAVDAFVGRGRGAILNVASTAAFKPMAGLGVYGSTKAFVRGLSLALAVELAPHGVDVCVVHPGPVRTPMLEAALGRPIAPTGTLGRLLERAYFMDADVCARRCLDGFRRGRTEVVVDHVDRFVVRLPRPVIRRVDDWSLRLLTGTA